MSSGHPKVQSTARGVVSLTSAQFAATLLGYAVHCVATRWMSDTDYGRLAVALSILNWLTVLISITLSQGLGKALSERHERLEAVLRIGRTWYALVVGLVTGLALIAAPVLALVFGDGALLMPLMVAGLHVPLTALFFFNRDKLAALRHYAAAAGSQFTYAITRAIGSCTLILLGLGAVGVLLGGMIGAGLAGLVALRVLLRMRTTMTPEPCPNMLRRSWIWTAITLPTTLTIATVVSLDLWMVKALVADDAAAGMYGAAVALAALPRFMAVGLNGAVFPRVSHAMANGDLALARSVTREALRVLLIVFVPTCALIAGSAPEVTALLFSARYARAGAPLAVLIVAMTCHAVFTLTQSVLAAANRPGVRAIAAGTMLPVGLALNLLLIPRFNIQGAAMSALGTLALGALIGCVLARRYVGMTPPWWSALRCGLAGAGVYVLGRCWPTQGWQVVGKLAVLGVAFLAGLVLLGELRKKDLAALRRAFRR